LPRSYAPILKRFKKGIYSFPITSYGFSNLPNFNDHAFAIDVDHVPLEVSINASALIIGPGETVTLTANHYLAETYEWSNNETTQSITMDQPGMYSVTISDGCCSSGTVEIEVMEDVINDVSTVDDPDYIIFPNSAIDFFNVVFENGQKI